jgi:hypothetical protein
MVNKKCGVKKWDALLYNTFNMLLYHSPHINPTSTVFFSCELSEGMTSKLPGIHIHLHDKDEDWNFSPDSSL